MGTACSRCHTPVTNNQVKCPVCGSAGTYEISKLDVDKISVAEEEPEQIAKEEVRKQEEDSEQIAKDEEEWKQQEYDNSVEANRILKQKLREKTIFLIFIALILIGVAFSYTVFFGLEY